MGNLTEREKIALLFGMGYINEQIAVDLGISERTIRRRIDNLVSVAVFDSFNENPEVRMLWIQKTGVDLKALSKLGVDYQPIWTLIVRGDTQERIAFKTGQGTRTVRRKMSEAANSIGYPNKGRLGPHAAAYSCFLQIQAN